MYILEQLKCAICNPDNAVCVACSLHVERYSFDLYILKNAAWQLFQEESLRVGWHENQDSSMVERQDKDLEVRVRVPVHVQIFPLKCNKYLNDNFFMWCKM